MRRERSTHQRRLSTVSLSCLGPFPAAAAPRRSTRKQDYHVIRFRMGEGKQQSQLKARLLQALVAPGWMVRSGVWGHAGHEGSYQVARPFFKSCELRSEITPLRNRREKLAHSSMMVITHSWLLKASNSPVTTNSLAEHIQSYPSTFLECVIASRYSTIHSRTGPAFID